VVFVGLSSFDGHFAAGRLQRALLFLFADGDALVLRFTCMNIHEGPPSINAGLVQGGPGRSGLHLSARIVRADGAHRCHMGVLARTLLDPY
jgi:hypothetical protein